MVRTDGFKNGQILAAEGNTSDRSGRTGVMANRARDLDASIVGVIRLNG